MNPPPQKQLSTQIIWLWLLLPMFTMLLMVLAWWGAAQAEVESLEEFFWIIFSAQMLVTGVSWIFFGIAVGKRCKTGLVVTFVLLFPVVHACVQFAIFFGGCLAVINKTGFQIHGPPDGYENRHKETSPAAEAEPDTDSDTE